MATRQRQRLRLGRVWLRLFNLMKSQLCIPKRSIGARRCAKTRATEQLISLEREKDRKAGETEDGIGNKGETGNRHRRRLEKPWKINYRSCKGVENYIDRRRMPKVAGIPSISPPLSFPNTVISTEQRVIL